MLQAFKDKWISRDFWIYLDSVNKLQLRCHSGAFLIDSIITNKDFLVAKSYRGSQQRLATA